MTPQFDMAQANRSRVETGLSHDANTRACLQGSHDIPAQTSDPASLIRDIAASSRDLDRTIQIIVCIPAFRRPDHLRLTLESIRNQRTSRQFAVVIVENDAVARTSAAEARRFLDEGAVQGVCVVEPRQGNCQAINAAFATALAMFPQATALLMIDDDEVASPEWLDLMLQAAETTGADIVGGPVLPQFEDARMRHLGRHPAFCPAYDRTGVVPLIYGSGNCLIRRRVFDALSLPSFDLRFNFLGGGDTDFFVRCREAGLRFFWIAEAEIRETVPAARTRTRWIATRGLRIGAINYHVQWNIATTAWSKAKLAAKMLALPAASIFAMARLLLSGQHYLVACHPIIVAVGSALASIGIEPHQYRAK